MSSRKRRIYANDLAQARAHDMSGFKPGGGGYQYRLTFERATGLATIAGRAVVVTMTGAELATAVGAIPAVAMDADGEDLKALQRVMRLLRTAGIPEAARS